MQRKWFFIVSIAFLMSIGTFAEVWGFMDAAVMEKWSSAKVVKYLVEGVHSGRTSVVFGDYEGKADVVDRVTVEFTWDVQKRALIGSVTVADGKSELSNLKSDGTNCPPPKLDDEYEHFQSVSNELISGDQIQIKGTRTYPAASVSNYPASCSMRAIPGEKEEAFLWVARIEPEALGMPNSPGSPISIATDRNSFTVKGADNWVWTYTPSRLQ